MTNRQNPSPRPGDLMGGPLVDGIPELTSLMVLEAENVHSECTKGSRTEEEGQSELVTFSDAIESPIPVMLTPKPPMDTKMPMGTIIRVTTKLMLAH